MAGSGVQPHDGKDGPDLPDLGAPRYQLLELSSESDLACIYLAYDRDLKRQVALRLVRAEALTQRFLAEVRVVARLDHPGIVPVLDVGLTAGGLAYCTMPVVRGRTLRRILDELKSGDEAVSHRYSLTHLVQVFLQVVQAVAYARGLGVRHRDLKPENVMLGEYGEVQLLDRGLTRVEDSVEIDERIDVRALGVLFYEVLTLERPPTASTGEAPEAPRSRAPQRAIPLALERACLGALAAETAAGHGTAEELRVEVQAWLEADADQVQRHQRAEEKAREGRALLEEFLHLKVEVARL